MLKLLKDLILNVSLIHIEHMQGFHLDDNNFHVAGNQKKCFFDYDAALITLPTTFNFNSNVNAACLPDTKVVPSR